MPLNDFIDLGALLCNFFSLSWSFKLFDGLILRAMRSIASADLILRSDAKHRVSKDAPPGAPFEAASRRLRARRLRDLDEVQKTARRRGHFATRNQSFRTAARKPLKSLRAPNQLFRGILCFQTLIVDFVSPFSCIVCFQWLGSIFRFAASGHARPGSDAQKQRRAPS
jgi:hypothetical protein